VRHLSGLLILGLGDGFVEIWDYHSKIVLAVAKRWETGIFWSIAEMQQIYGEADYSCQNNGSITTPRTA